MAKVQIKYGNITPFGGQFFVADQFERHIVPHADYRIQVEQHTAKGRTDLVLETKTTL